MTLPLALLNDNTDNVYELSVAMTRRAYQIALSGEADRVDEKANGADEVNEKADGVERENESVKPGGDSHPSSAYQNRTLSARGLMLVNPSIFSTFV